MSHCHRYDTYYIVQIFYRHIVKRRYNISFTLEYVWFQILQYHFVNVSYITFFAKIVITYLHNDIAIIYYECVHAGSRKLVI